MPDQFEVKPNIKKTIIEMTEAATHRPLRYGTPPPLDIKENKDKFELWELQWVDFIQLSTLNEQSKAEQDKFTTCLLRSCLSMTTLEIIFSSGLTKEELASHTHIIQVLRQRCNAGRNHQVWRHQFPKRK